MPQTIKGWFTVMEVSRATGWSVAKVHRHIDGGSFPGARKLGRNWLLPEEPVRTFFRAQRAAAQRETAGQEATA